MTTLKKLPERAHHVFIDVGGDTFDDMMSLVDNLIEGVRDGGASTVSGGYSSGGFYVYRQSGITHDEYMAVIDQRNSGEYHMRSDDELMADAELEALRAENARLRAELDAAPRWVSVTERRPEPPREPDEYIVAHLNNSIFVPAMHDGDGWFEFDTELEDWLPLTGVTHWYRVPELPPAPEVEP